MALRARVSPKRALTASLSPQKSPDGGSVRFWVHGLLGATGAGEATEHGVGRDDDDGQRSVDPLRFAYAAGQGGGQGSRNSGRSS